MERSAVRAVLAVAPACMLALGLASRVRADGSAAPAPPPTASSDAATNQELRQAIELLKKRLAELERELDQKPAAGSVQLQEKKEPAKGEGEEKAEEKGGKDEEEEGPPATAQSVLTANKSKLTFDGFAQIRLTNIGSQTGNPTPNTNVNFQVARFRPHLTYTHDAHWSSEVDINGTTRQNPGSNDSTVAGFSPQDLFIQWQNAGMQARIGQSKIPFGYEIYLESDTLRVEMERARILTTLYPDERDIGLFFRTTPQNKRAVWGAVAVYNGNGVNHDDNNGMKDFAGTVKVPLDANTTVGVSAEYGNFTPNTPGPAFERSAAGTDVEYIRRRGYFKMEALAGRNLGANLWGGYIGGHYDTGHYGGPFFRFDTFDPNLAVGGDLWRRYAMGWYKDFTKKVRLTGEYDRVQNQSASPGTPAYTYGVQVQTVF